MTIKTVAMGQHKSIEETILKASPSFAKVQLPESFRHCRRDESVVSTGIQCRDARAQFPWHTLGGNTLPPAPRTSISEGAQPMAKTVVSAVKPGGGKLSLPGLSCFCPIQENRVNFWCNHRYRLLRFRM
ncbi:hypothetical protein [Paracidovorax wautersii]|uniref:Uncharacterized protein n=1 Tax=Paracidovorax wautersii TaxID=1177982 RepID=A0ABU1ICS4_9BURK|nr:hypothetical protein [Paracidovorax wautersii]MDR6215028.1 hypothetical protein [Paracidovorax wautersii]